ncbi:hypothetical protein BDR26DRAFT_913907 [Obelidium mucronatum]|nr:hypothetical protein BDR26DRAFT_913907 [Obelidium mucronatum]
MSSNHPAPPPPRTASTSKRIRAPRSQSDQNIVGVARRNESYESVKSRELSKKSAIAPPPPAAPTAKADGPVEDTDNDQNWEDAKAVASKFKWAKKEKTDWTTVKVVAAGQPLLEDLGEKEVPVSYTVMQNTKANLIIGSMGEEEAAALPRKQKKGKGKNVKFRSNSTLESTAPTRSHPKRMSSFAPNTLPSVAERKQYAAVSKFNEAYTYHVGLQQPEDAPATGTNVIQPQPQAPVSTAKAASKTMMKIVVIDEPTAADSSDSAEPHLRPSEDNNWIFEDPDYEPAISSINSRRSSSHLSNSGNGRSKSPFQKPQPITHAANGMKVIKSQKLKERMMQKLENQKEKMKQLFVPGGGNARRNTPQQNELAQPQYPPISPTAPFATNVYAGSPSPVSPSGHGPPPGYLPGQPAPPPPGFIPGQPAPPPAGFIPSTNFLPVVASPYNHHSSYQPSPSNPPPSMQPYNNRPVNIGSNSQQPSIQRAATVPRPSTLTTSVSTISAPRPSTSLSRPPGPRPRTTTATLASAGPGANPAAGVKYENKGYETITQDMVQADIFDSYVDVDESVLDVIPAPPPKDSFSALDGEFAEFQKDMMAEKAEGRKEAAGGAGGGTWVGWLFGGKPAGAAGGGTVPEPRPPSNPADTTAGSEALAPSIPSRKDSKSVSY